MNSTNIEIISTQEKETPLLHHNPPQQPRIKNLKTKIIFVLRILIVLVAGLLILYYIYSKNQKKPEPHSPYLSGLSNYYCHLTRHPKLCHDSMSSVTNATALQPDPALIFVTSLQLVVAQLNHTAISVTISVTRALTLPASNASLVGPGLSTCQALIRDSLSRLDRSLGLDLFYYEEDHKITDEVKTVKNNSDSCLLALREIDREVGVEEVKLGVEKASMLLVNFISLYQGRHFILDDFYTRFVYFEDEGYNYFYSYFSHLNSSHWYGFDYGLMVCLYSVMYLFVALLYFLFWQ